MNSMIQGFVTSAVLIVIVLILRQLCRGKISPTLQYGIWLIVAVKLLVPVSFGESAFSALTILKRAESLIWEVSYAEEEPMTVGVAGTDSNLETTYVVTEDSDFMYLPTEEITVMTYPATEDSVTEHNYLPIEENVKETSAADKFRQHPFWQAVPYIICVNAVLLGAWMLIYNLKFYHCLRRTRIAYVGKEEEKSISGNRNRKSAPHIYLTEVLTTPCLFGTSIYLPLDMAQDETKLRHILAHETAHYRHKDFIWAMLRLFCVVLNWYNPFVWLAAAAAKEDCELACDEAAIKVLGEEERIAYGETLVSLVGAKQAQDAFSVTTTMTGSKKELMRRIVLIAEKPVMQTSMTVFAGLILAAAVLFTFTGEVQAAETPAAAEDNPQEEERKTEGLLSAEEDYFVAEPESADDAYGGVIYSETFKDNGYGDMLGDEVYQPVQTYEADVSEAEGIETIRVYAGDAGDGNGGGYVTVEDAEGKLLYMNGGYLERAGWNNIYLHEQGEDVYLFDLYAELRGSYGELRFHAFRLDAEGNPLPLNEAEFLYEADTYEEESFLQWASDMNTYLSGSFLLLSTQDGVLNTEPVEEFEKYEKNTLNQQILNGLSY